MPVHYRIGIETTEWATVQRQLQSRTNIDSSQRQIVRDAFKAHQRDGTLSL